MSKALLMRVFAFAVLGSNIALAGTISVSFVGGSGVNGTPVPLGPADLAGVVPAMHWNSVANNAPVGNTDNLLDSNGAITSARLVWLSNNTWSNQITSTDPDSRMMKGYLDNAGGPATVIIMSGIPYSTYDVYVYFKSDNTSVAGTIGQFTLNSKVIYGANTGPVPPSGMFGMFVEASGSSAGDPNAIGNYLVFHGISGSSFNLAAEAAKYTAAVTGLQIQLVPEPPPSFVLVGSAFIVVAWGRFQKMRR
jgi:hypothetical protein